MPGIEPGSIACKESAFTLLPCPCPQLPRRQSSNILTKSPAEFLPGEHHSYNWGCYGDRSHRQAWVFREVPTLLCGEKVKGAPKWTNSKSVHYRGLGGELPLTSLAFFQGIFLRAPFSFFHVTYCSHFFLLRFRLSVPQTGAWIFVKGSSQAVIRMIGCEMTSVLFSFLWDSSLVFCLVSSLGDVTEICKIAQLWYTGRLPIPSSCSEHQS